MFKIQDVQDVYCRSGYTSTLVCSAGRDGTVTISKTEQTASVEACSREAAAFTVTEMPPLSPPSVVLASAHAAFNP